MLRRIAVFALACLGADAHADEVDFVRDIQPLFQAKCIRCHGPEKQRGGFRLDRRADAIQGGEEHRPAILPGKSAMSPLVRLLRGELDGKKMPPDGPPLEPAQIERISRWIDQGARWPEEKKGIAVDPIEAAKNHWAYQPVVRPMIPATKNATWARNPIDRFILAALEKAGLEPSPEADRPTLIRRLHFDLVGLPPTPEEVDAFVADRDPNAYEKLLDRLLASPHYGERWARHWLDVVRFAESHGFEMNQPRPNAWRFRDYAIRSLNEDKPYDQFVREQIAGDAFGADEGTGFLVGGPWDQVKSPDPILTAQQRAEELHDMIGTTGSAFLGLTVGCARCHTHKFDPIPQTDYYRLKACFEGVQHGDRSIAGAKLPRAVSVAQIRRDIETIQRKLDAFEPRARLGRRLFLTPDDATLLAPAHGKGVYPAGTGRGEADDVGDGTRLPNLGVGYPYWDVQGKDVIAWRPSVEGRYRVWVSWGCGWSTHASDTRYVLDGDGNLATTADQTEILRADQRKFADGSGDLPGKPLWSGFRDAGVHAFRSDTRIVLSGGTKGIATADAIVLEEVVSGSDLSAKQPSLRIAPQSGRNVDRFEPVLAKHLRFTVLASSDAEPCIDELEAFTAGADPRNVALASLGTKATASGSLAGFPIHKLEHINDGAYGNDRSWISNERGRGWVALEFAEPTTIDRVEWSRDRQQPPKFRDRTAVQYRIETSLDGKTWRLAASSGDRLPYGRRAAPVPGGFLPDVSEPSPQRTTLLAELRRKQAALPAEETGTVAYVGRFVQPGVTARLHRGDPTQPRESMAPGSLTQFGSSFGLAENAPERERRVALAKWIADAKHPLTARVMANRVWHYRFGIGIVSTPSDLGVNGGRPSHPELLDWLASEFVAPQEGNANAWSLKHLHRLMCLSATYRQASLPNPKANAVDAGARLLWRFPPCRLEAEPLRDAILAVTGKLNLKAGGPGFDLFEPNGNYVKVYAPKKTFGPDEFRRMIYQAKPRMQLDDTFGVFDCPDAGQVAPRRGSSTTPLQAFNLLNSPFMLQQADFFAERLRREAGDDAPSQVQRAFRLTFGRAPGSEESAAAQTLIRQHGLAAFCRALLSANEFLYVF